MKLVGSVKLNYYHYKNNINTKAKIRLTEFINNLTSISNKSLNKKDKPNIFKKIRKKKFKYKINFKLKNISNYWKFIIKIPSVTRKLKSELINNLTSISNKSLNKKDKPNIFKKIRKKKFKYKINLKLKNH